MQNPINKFILALTLATLSLGCSKEANFSLLSDSDAFVQGDGSTANNKLDVLFVINDQPSMSSFQQKLVTSFSSFMTIFMTKGFDFKIAVVTTSAYMADPTLSGYNPAHEDAADFNDYDGTTYSGVYVIHPTTPDIFSVFAINAKPSKNSAGQDARSFSSMRQALQSTRPINLGFVRPDAFLAVVIVDNQEDFSGNERCNGCNMNQRYNAPTLDPVGLYVDFLDTKTNTSGDNRRYSVSAMTQIAQPCQGGTNMVRIMELANLTGGVLGDICQADFGPSMVMMADEIATLSTRFYLDRIPKEETITVRVDGILVPKSETDGWTYHADANAIEFHGSAVPAQGSKIKVDYDPLYFGA